jgi:hypothetical protein
MIARPTPPTLPFLHNQIVKEQRTKTLSSRNPNQKQNQPTAEPSSPAIKTNFPELRSQNPVASDVAAVDEARYTQTN